MDIFTRPSEWDYSWLNEYPSEASLAHLYEYARYALLVAAPDPRFVFPDCFGAGPYQWGEILELWGPLLCLLYDLPKKVKFPQMTYREARQFLACGETTTATIEVFSQRAVQSEQKLAIHYKEVNQQQAEDILARLKRPHTCGAGARIRQDRTDLKCLGATKLLDCRTAPDAIALTADILGRPLYKNESDWSQARKRACAILEPYRVEAADLYRAFRPPNGGI